MALQIAYQPAGLPTAPLQVAKPVVQPPLTVAKPAPPGPLQIAKPAVLQPLSVGQVAPQQITNVGTQGNLHPNVIKKSVNEFAAAIKQKYPAYATADDQQLVSAMLEKYPQYAEQVELPPTPEAPTRADTIRSGITQGLKQAGNDAIGIGKGIADTAIGTGKLIAKQVLPQFLQQGYEALTGRKEGIADPLLNKYAEKVKPTDEQKRGYVGEKVAELFLPGPKDLSLGSKVADKVEESAVGNYARTLGPTTKANKFITERVAPELAKRQVVSLTRKGLLDKAEQQVENVGQQLEQAYESLPEGTKVYAKPIYDKLQNLKQKFVVEGTDVIANPEAHSNIEKMQRLVAQTAQQGDVSVNSLRNLRQILDSSVREAGGFFGKPINDTALLSAKKATADAIRGELAEKFPDIAKINKEFNFWKGVEDVLTASVTRDQAKGVSLGERIMQGGVTAGEIATKASALKAVLAGEIAKNAVKLFRSTAWNTIAGATKSKLASYLASGQSEKAALLIVKLLADHNVTSQQ